MGKGQGKIDEFAFILLAGVILIIILMFAWGTPPVEAAPIVEPTSFSVSIPNGTSRTFDLKIIGAITNVTLSSSGEIAGWVSFNKNNFDIISNDIVKVTISAPSSPSFKTYTGKINVVSTGGQASVDITISVLNLTTALASRGITLNDFSILYTEASKTLSTKENFEVSRGYFSGKEANFVAEISEKDLSVLTGAKISIHVDETNDYGNLIVSFNNKEVFNDKVNPGLKEIPLPTELVKESNTVRIKAGLPGLRFWANTVYRIQTAKLIVELKGIYTKEIPFSLSKDEVANFQYFHLTFRSNYTEIPPQLIITINDQIAYMGPSTYTWWDLNFTKDVFGGKFYIHENNTISFSFENIGYLEIKNGLLEVYYNA